MENATSEVTIEVQPRDVGGTGVCKRLRAEGLLPGVVYSKGQKGANLILSERDFVKAASSSLPSQIFTLRSTASELDGRKVVVKDIQRSPVKSLPLHVDFQFLEENNPIAIKVPLTFSGEPVGVRQQGGIFTKAARDLKLICVGDAIPTEIEVQVGELALGDRIRSGDIELPAGTRLAGSDRETLASVVAGRAARTAAAEEKKEEAAAEGAAPAQG